MPKKKVLYIVVSNYPYGNGEPFLEDELNILAQNFDKVVLIITGYEAINFKNSTPKFSIPNKVELIFYSPKSDIKSKIKALIFSFSNPVVLDELKIIKQTYRLPLSIGIMRLLFSYIIHGIEFKDYLYKIIKETEENQSNYFYTYWCTFYTLGLALIKQKNINLKAFSRVHRWDLYMNVHTPQYLPFRSFIINKLDKVFSVSEDGKKYLTATIPAIDTNNISVNYLGTTINRFPTIKKIDNKIFILSISFIFKEKRVDLLAEAISTISDFEIEWHHIGDGREEAIRVKELTKNLLDKKKNIKYTFHGILSKKEIYNFLNSNNITVLINTSWSEGIPVSIMEAMSFGIPVIATDVGGTREIVNNNKNGILLSANPTKEEVANAIRLLNQMKLSDYKIMSENAYQTWNTKFNGQSNYSILVNSIIKDNDCSNDILITCKQCLIDSKIYPDITLDSFGVCDVCRIVEAKNQKLKLQRDSNYLDNLLSEIRATKSRKKYDCIIGISGGVDSAYLATKAKEWGLHPLLVHIDNGWNSEIAVHNIHTLIKQLDLDLYTVVINWLETRDIVKSFLKASVIDIDWANEMCAQAALYDVAKKFKVKHILTGHQLATEGWMPENVVHYKLDLINFRAIHKKFGTIKLKTYPTIGYLKTYYYEHILGMKYYYPLDYIDYNKEKVKDELVKVYGWKDYGQKHFESIFTRFYQGYILIKKFKIDKRKFHYSSAILSGQMTKEEAIELVSSNEYEKSGLLKQDKEYVIKKLGFTNDEFEEILNATPKLHTDYPSIINITKKLKFAINILRKIKNATKNSK